MVCVVPGDQLEQIEDHSSKEGLDLKTPAILDGRIHPKSLALTFGQGEQEHLPCASPHA